MNIITKFLFWLKKPKLILILAEERSIKIENIISFLLKGEKNIFVLNNFEKGLDEKSLTFLIKNSSLSLVVYDGEKKEIKNLFPSIAVCKFEKAEDFSFRKTPKILTIGFNDSSDFMATELNFDNETNFKIIHEGDTIPFWIDKKIDKNELSDFLLAIVASDVMGQNLVQISQKLKNIAIS